MGAICKTIEIHSDNLQPLLDYGSDNDKTSLDANDIQNLLSYAANPDKTTIQLPQEGEQSLLVSGVLCNPATANEEFAILRNKYRENNPEYLPAFDFFDKKSNAARNVQKHPVTAIHIIQSFEGDVDPRVAHQIGIELLERLGIQGVVDTHMNTNHVHNHIIGNAYMPDGMTKFYMNKEKRIELRRLSDEIQREYGLEITFLDPEQQQKIANRSLNYKEWAQQREGKSWKEKMRGDIAVARDIADDKDEFIEVMKDYGYSIEKQKGKDSIMWFNSENGRTIWDSTLGDEYMLCNLFPDEKPEHELVVETEKDKKPSYHSMTKVISVSKYDYNGHRRSEIELLIRRAIAIIQRVSNLINKHRNNKLHQKYNAKAKLEIMQEALSTLKEFGIESADDLNDKLDLAGKNLSISKGAVSRVNGEMQYYSVVERVIAEYQNAKTLYDSVKFWAKPHDLHLNQFSKRDIALGIAQIAPLSDKEKSELFQMLEKRPNLRLVDAGKGYCNISAIQFRQIKDYFKGSGEKPDCLVNVDETTASFAYERQYQFLSEKIVYEPSKAQRNKAKALLVEHGFDNIDADKLTMADIINIDNCWGECPFSYSLITPEQQRTLENMLTTAGRSVNRPLSNIMENEYEQIINFLDGRVKKLPSVMKAATLPSETDLKKTNRLALTLGIKPSMDMNYMTAEDVRNFYNWLISQGREPMCTNAANAVTWEHNKSTFHADIECETPRKQEVLIGLRNATNTLIQLGISPDDIPQVLTHIEQLKAEQKELKETHVEFAEQYKQLLRLKQQTSHAKDKNFLFGSLFDESEIKAFEEQIEKQEQEKDMPPETSDTPKENDVDKALATVKKLVKKHHILDTDLDL